MLNKGWIWFRQTSTLVGIPVMFLLVVMGAQKFLFTATCQMVGYRCEYAIGASDAVHDYIDDLLAAPSDEPPVLNKRSK